VRPGHKSSRRLQEGFETDSEIAAGLVAMEEGQLVDQQRQANQPGMLGYQTRVSVRGLTPIWDARRAATPAGSQPTWSMCSKRERGRLSGALERAMAGGSCACLS
jgi:hypothetical protein